jgi:histidine kinase-like protein
VLNAVIHGTGENSYKLVCVECRCCMDGEVSITVRDEGSGFNSEEVANPTTLENLLFTHGRGIYLMRTLMDEVSFEEGGSVVRIRKTPTVTSLLLTNPVEAVIRYRIGANSQNQGDARPPSLRLDLARARLRKRQQQTQAEIVPASANSWSSQPRLEERYLGFATKVNERSALGAGRWVRKSACGSREETRPAPIQAYRLIKAPMTKQAAAR